MIDKKKALDDFQITEEMYDEMLVEFTVQADEKIRRIEDALKCGNVKEAEEHSHSLKGVSGNLRLDDCYSITSAIDLALKTAPPQPVDAKILDLKRAIDEVRNSIRR